MYAIVGFGPTGYAPTGYASTGYAATSFPPMQVIMLPSQPTVLSPVPSAKSGPSPDPIGVCLDYAMGTCTRAQCKYPHPDATPLHRMREQYGHQGVVCEVYALTGHCRFGAKCTKTHPAFDAPSKDAPQIPVSLREDADSQPTASSPVPAPPKHVTFRPTPVPFAPTDGRVTPEAAATAAVAAVAADAEAAVTPSKRKASDFETFAADMRRSLEHLEGHVPTKQPAGSAPGPGQPLLSCGMGSIFMDILQDLHEIPY